MVAGARFVMFLHFRNGLGSSSGVANLLVIRVGRLTARLQVPAPPCLRPAWNTARRRVMPGVRKWSYDAPRYQATIGGNICRQ
jgi:hypothetical protein